MEDLIVSILAEVSVSLANHGGSVEFVGFNPQNGALSVRFAGVCRTCPLAAFTLERGVASVVRERVPAVKSVILVE
jgi:Fe-S cluster biogenesis protein NfuA